MDAYEKEIFNYFTKKENFISAYEIYQLFPEVRNELIGLFWHSVKSVLIEMTKDSDWSVVMDDNIFAAYSKLGLHLISDENANVRVIYEQLHGKTYYGVWLNIENEALDSERINAYAEKVSAIQSMKRPRSGYWLGWDYIGQDFNNLETLKRLLPENSEEFTTELANMLFEFGKEIRDDIAEMSKMTKNKNTDIV